MATKQQINSTDTEAYEEMSVLQRLDGSREWIPDPRNPIKRFGVLTTDGKPIVIEAEDVKMGGAWLEFWTTDYPDEKSLYAVAQRRMI